MNHGNVTRSKQQEPALFARTVLLTVLACAAPATLAAPTYRNPLNLRLPGGALAQNCADPALLRDPGAAQPTWYLYCTTDPVSKAEKDDKGWRFRLLPIYRSHDLVEWEFVTDAFAERPAPATRTAGLWAPEPVYLNGRYYLYYTITDVDDAHSPEPGCDTDSAIAVATSATPAGPWTPAPGLVVAPRRAGPGCKFHWTYDPDVLTQDDGRHYLYYGSYGGGMFVQRLAEDGLAVQGAPVRVGTTWRYEGAEVVRHGGYYYLFASATNCCAGPLTGYALYVGRATRPEGPFLDRQGGDMAAARVGGTPVLPQNGNRWIGPGHNTVFQDGAGQWWTIYHAVDRNEPYFAAPDLTRRLALLDRVDWVDGWPVVAAGRGPSDTSLPAPAPLAGDADALRPPLGPPAEADVARRVWHETFTGPRLGRAWQWLRRPPAADWRTGQGGLAWRTGAGDLYGDVNSAAVLTRALPAGDVRIDAKVRLDAPEDCCATHVQAGLVVLGDDDNYVKLAVLADAGLHQVEFAKEGQPEQAGWPRYGNTVAGTPGHPWTWLRLEIRHAGDEQQIAAWSSQDGRAWVGGGVWTHRLARGGKPLRLGLVAMGGGRRPAVFSSVTAARLSR
ncbi:arabinan endo-1,5-alpha-L-arabinosidase [Massilia sp. YMA4]|nr:arabinan endo-1,5-alpha-L-arabinosidase [Massilia sp. YMA4]